MLHERIHCRQTDVRKLLLSSIWLLFGATNVASVQDEGVRRIVDSQLSELGYKVLCASSGVEALDCLDGGLRVDLLFTDIVMGGGMDGIELARAATERKPALKVLHTSGFTSAATLESTTVKRLLSKPYRKAVLAAAVREALDAEPNTEIRVL